MGKKGRKQPGAVVLPADRGKTPRGGAIADRVGGMRFSWRVDLVDFDGNWGWEKATARVVLSEVVPKLHNFETMNWADVEGPSGSHFVSVDSLCDGAQERLKEINQVDLDKLFSLRITGERRLWGVRDGHVLRVLWWDPKHEVCPSHKKHT